MSEAVLMRDMDNLRGQINSLGEFLAQNEGESKKAFEEASTKSTIIVTQKESEIQALKDQLLATNRAHVESSKNSASSLTERDMEIARLKGQLKV